MKKKKNKSPSSQREPQTHRADDLPEHARDPTQVKHPIIWDDEGEGEGEAAPGEN